MSRTALTTLAPLWAVAVVLSLAHVLAGHDRPSPVKITLLDNALFVVSAAILPFVAGFLYTRRCNGTVLKAVLIGATIPVADIAGVAIAYAALQAAWLALFGFVIATIMFSLAPAALFGAAGAWTARKYEPKHT